MYTWHSLLPDDRRLIEAIARRWYWEHQDNPFDTAYAVALCHANGCQLDLNKLHRFDDMNFVHDLVGIRNNLDYKTGRLRDCFLPRSHKPATQSTRKRGPT